MIKIGIICAGDRELEPFLAHIENCVKSTKAMLTFHEGKINDMNIVALFCGVCKTNAALATQILIDTYNTDIIINAGTAGGMRFNLDIFDTVISTEAVHHDVHESILTEFHPWMDTIFIKADKNLLDMSERLINKFQNKYKILKGRMVTGESFITEAGRDEINSKYEPLSVDMETASIAHVCYVNSIPFIAIRTITDTADHSGAEHFDKNCAKASSISKDIVLELLNEIKIKERSIL